MEAQKANLTSQLAVVADKDNLITRLTSELKAIQEERGRLEASLKKSESDVHELKDRLVQEGAAHSTAAGEEKKAAEAKLASLQEEISQLRTDLREADDRLAAAKAQAEATPFQEDAATLQTALEVSQKERLGLAAQLEQAERMLKQHRGDLEKAEKKNSILQSVMEMKIASLKEELGASRDERDRLATKLAGFAQSTEMLDRLVDESSSTDPTRDSGPASSAAVPPS